MTREAFDALVTRLESRYARRPAALTRNLALWVVFGHAAFLVWLLLAILLGLAAYSAGAVLDPSAGIWLMIGGALLLTLGVVQTSVLLTVRLEPPRGRVLRADEVPQFWELIEELRQKAGCRVDQVLLTFDMNASVHQVPRLGVFGWHKRYLCIGLPLLDAMSPEEVRGVLAHEFAHLSGEHGRLGHWLYRLRVTWERLFERLHTTASSRTEQFLRKGVLSFVDWYWPRFNARAFVLSRSHEYFADAASAREVGSAAAATALWRLECFQRRLVDEFWPPLWQLANRDSQPPSDFVRRIRQALASNPEPAAALRWAEQASRSLTDNVETHPCFADRAWEMGEDSDLYLARGLPSLPRPSAADVYLGQEADALERDVSELWRETVESEWRLRHNRMGRLQEHIQSVNQSSVADVDPMHIWQKARAILDMDGPAAAAGLLQQILDLQPDHGPANLVLGRHLLSQGRSEGEFHLRRVLESDDQELIVQAGQFLADHFRSVGDIAQLQEVHRRLDCFAVDLSASQRERNQVRASDRFLPHDLESEELQPLIALLADVPGARAWLVRKDLKFFPQQRLFVLCVQTSTNWMGRSSDYQDADLVNRLAAKLKLPGRMLVIAPQGGFRRLARKIKRQAGSEIAT